MHYLIQIELGNDAMKTAGDVAEAVRRAIHLLEIPDRDEILTTPDEGPIRDVNGNTVGKWAVA